MKMTTRALLAQSLYADVTGLQADFENGTFTRLAGARGRTAGADFNCFAPFGGRRRCCVADDGTINAFYGEAGYAEDGSSGQVMVYQPKFYYRTEPLALTAQSTGNGYVLKKVNYYISPRPMPGFRLHPAFFGADGNPTEYILYSAYEASYYDASLGKMFVDGTDTDAVIDPALDRLCSLAGQKPVGGLYKSLTRTAAEQLAGARGTGWHIESMKAYAANQLLMIVEYGAMNLQETLGKGLVNLPNTSGVNCASLTGATAALGNASGTAAETVNERGGVTTVYSESGKTAVSYRGQENPWGNIWKMMGGVNLWGDGTMQGGVLYLCSDYLFEESKIDGNYAPAGFRLYNSGGCISALGYSGECDWLFFGAENLGDAAGPVGDYVYSSTNLNAYRTVLAGGYWDRGNYAGSFCFRMLDGPNAALRSVGARLMFVP